MPNALNRPVSASDLRFKATVQTQTVGADGASWSAGTAYSVDFEPIGARAMAELGLAGTVADFRFTFRPEVTIPEGGRILLDGKYYLIVSVQQVPRARTVVLARYAGDTA